MHDVVLLRYVHTREEHERSPALAVQRIGVGFCRRLERVGREGVEILGDVVLGIGVEGLTKAPGMDRLTVIALRVVVPPELSVSLDVESVVAIERVIRGLAIEADTASVGVKLWVSVRETTSVGVEVNHHPATPRVYGYGGQGNFADLEAGLDICTGGATQLST